MSGKFRNRSAAARSRVASPMDLQRTLKRSECVGNLKAAAPASAGGTSQPPAFLKDLSPEGELYDPQQPATIKLKEIIEMNQYGTFFENAIKTISAQNIPE